MSLASPASPHPTRRRFRTVLMFIGALFFLFEEWLWVGCMRVFKWLGRFGLLRWLDARLARLAPAAALVILCVPVALLFPVKIVGLWMIASGRFFTGCMVMLCAKIVSTAIIARLFLTCRSQLLRMPWFARLYNVTCALRVRIHRWIAEQPAWHEAKRAMAGIRHGMRAFFRGRGADGRVVRKGALLRWRRWRRKAATTAGFGRSADGDEGR